MRPRWATPGLPLRLLAAASFMVFVCAQALCFRHCHWGGRDAADAGEAVPSCHAAAAAASAADDESDSGRSDTGRPTTVCVTFKTMLVDSGATGWVAPEFSDLYLLGEVVPALDALILPAVDCLFRQARAPDRVWTPVVCLGPGFRSLAPPVHRFG